MPLQPPTSPGNQKNRPRGPSGNVIFLTSVATVALLIAGTLPNVAFAQGRSQKDPELKPISFRPERFPSPLRPTVRALGDRLHTEGKGRLTLPGTLTDSSGSNQVQLIYEVPGRFRLKRTGRGRDVGFDGKQPFAATGGSLSSAEEDLLESLSSDFPDGFFTSVRNGAHLKLVAMRVRTHNDRSVEYTGPWHDVFQLLTPVRERGQAPTRTKWYYFDSITGLLKKVSYIDTALGPETAIETRFDAWQTIAGQSIPGSITRLKSGVEVFQFQRAGVNISARQPDGAFSRNP